MNNYVLLFAIGLILAFIGTYGEYHYDQKAKQKVEQQQELTNGHER